MGKILTSTYISPRTDFGFKKLFSTEKNKELLIDFLNALIDKPDKIVDIRYLQTEHLGRTAKDRHAVFDIHCITGQEEWFVIEMQVGRQEYFLDRCLYYSTFPIQKQAKKGKDWNYELKPLYHIAILNFEQYDDAHYISHLSIVREETMVKATDKLNLILIELPKFTKTLQQSEERIDYWLYCFKHLDKLKERPEELSGKVFETLFEEAEINKLTQEEMDLYIRRYPPENDWNNIMDYARKEGFGKGMDEGIEVGIKEGIKKGIKEGIKKGEITKSFEMAKKCFQQKMPIELVAKLTGLTPEQLIELM
jgi:predicted transposase/invertase (TIGR01784 family)